ncbi:MAG: tetratricopeptide repeat protein, partial [Bacteroidota bacterium]
MNKRWYFIAMLLVGFIWIGCESSEEAMRREAEARQRQEEQQRLAELTSENSSVKQQVSRLESENSGLRARLSELERKLEVATRVPEPAQPTHTPMPMPAMDPLSAYDAGLNAFNEKRYDDAQGIFQDLLKSGVEESLADNCHYWIGESLFGKRSYREALSHFEMVLEYKVTEKKGDAYYMMGRCYEMQGDKAKAKELYEKVVKDYPTNDLVQKAKGRWEKL